MLGSEREPTRSRSDDGGGMRRFWGRVFGDGENPLGWSLPLYRWSGISVRVHLLFLVYIAAELVRAVSQSSMGFWFTAMLLGAIFGLVLLHEYGHCFACRRTGGEADEVILWPLGGLAMVAPPHTWKAHLITVLGGPGVNAVLLLPLAGVTWAVTGSLTAVVFNPFDPGGALATVNATGGWYWAVVFVWCLHYANMVLLAFNMLVPMYPMDAGRVVQAVLWRTMGYARSMEIAVVVGLATAGVMAVVGLVFNELLLLALAVFGGLVCWQERSRLRAMGAEEPWSASFERSATDEQAFRAEATRREKAAEERAEVDRILAKISAQGMKSLTSKERRTLKRASAKGE